MKLIAVNGSNRKNWNTARLLESALAGAASQGAQTELVHLYDLDYKGCYSCFACKRKNGPSYGRCRVRDGLEPLLRKIEQADALLLGSPVYFRSLSGEMRSFLERLLFPLFTYTNPPQSLAGRKTKVGFIYTMNVSEQEMIETGTANGLSPFEYVAGLVFGPVEHLYSWDTFQFDDYSRYVSSRFDPQKKAKQRDEVFPQDLEKARELGMRLAK